MVDEPIQFQLTPEEVRQIIQGVLPSLSNALVNCRPIDQLVTVDERCKQRWPTASKKHQRRVRDVCVGIYRERLGRHPLKLTGHLNGTYAVEREHLDILDLAIDIVRDEVAAKESMPLFSHRPR